MPTTTEQTHLIPTHELSRDAELLEMQSPGVLPVDYRLVSGTDLLIPPRHTGDRLEHFGDEYDLSSSSHLSKFVKVILGDSGAGMIKKRWNLTRLQNTLNGAHFLDLDFFYGALFGLQRYPAERYSLDPYEGMLNEDEWDEVHSKDSDFRSRIHQFGKAVHLCPTPEGMKAVAAAMLSVDCELYEAWELLDVQAPDTNTGHTYDEVEGTYATYGDMDGISYNDIAGVAGTFGSLISPNRHLFIVRPKRAITLGEKFVVEQMLKRLKPAMAMVLVDSDGVALHKTTRIRAVAADSEYWQVQSLVKPGDYKKPQKDPYKVLAGVTAPTATKRPAFSAYQGEAWSYNGDIKKVSAYSESEPGVTSGTLNYERIVFSNNSGVNFTPDKGILPAQDVLQSRYASDAILKVNPYVGRHIPYFPGGRVTTGG